MKIFISYRRDDCAAEAASIYFGLQGLLPDSEVFIDRESIPMGAEFPVAIRRQLDGSDVILILIGDDWMTLKSDNGTPRIEDPDDFVSIEVAHALQRSADDCLVLPVMVEGAEMPTPSELPESLRALPHRNAFKVRKDSITGDVKDLARKIRQAAPVEEAAAPKTGVEKDAGITMPKRFTEKWFRDNGPLMSADDLVVVIAALRGRRWSDGWVIDYLVPYLPDGVRPQVRQPLGNARRGRRVVPDKITTAWLDRSASGLDRDEVAAVAAAMAERGWTPGSIEDCLFASVDPAHLTPKPF